MQGGPTVGLSLLQTKGDVSKFNQQAVKLARLFPLRQFVQNLNERIEQGNDQTGQYGGQSAGAVVAVAVVHEGCGQDRVRRQ